MAISRHHMFTHSTICAAVLVLSGAVGACSADLDPVTVSDSALTGGSPCEGVILEASRFYKPKSRTDGYLAFASGSLSFPVPSTIPVIAGEAGHGKAKFSWSSNGNDVTCVYRGLGGKDYYFVRCKAGGMPSPDLDDDDIDRGDEPGDPLPTAGTVVTADRFNLRINRGNKQKGTTTAQLHLGGPVIDDNNACTVDACNDGVVSHTPISVDDGDACTTDTCDPANGPSHTLVNTPFCRGQAAFNDNVAHLGGNGRACSTCHVPGDDFTLKPATVQARLEQRFSTGVDDPLFRAIDADVPANGVTETNFENLKAGLIRVNFHLPDNVFLVDCGNANPCPATAPLLTDVREAGVWRAVPTVHNVRVTGPDGQLPTWVRQAGDIAIFGANQNGGFQHDGRFGTLQIQATGALNDHAQISTQPSTGFLDDLAAFQNASFSSTRVESVANNTSLDPLPADSELDADEQEGKQVFIRSCMQCHGGPGLSTPINSPPAFVAGERMPRYHNVNAGCPRPAVPGGRAFDPCPDHVARNIRTYAFRQPDGTFVRRTTSDPGRSLITGIDAGSPAVSDFQRFDNTGLHGISKTAPYFHNNSAATLEDVLNHYESFFGVIRNVNPRSNILATTTPGVQDRPFTAAEKPKLLKFLFKL